MSVMVGGSAKPHITVHHQLHRLAVVVVLDPFRGMGMCQRWCAGEAQMRDKPGSELNPAVDSAGAARRILLPFYLAKVKSTKEDCDRGSKDWAVYCGRGREGPFLLKKPKESGKRDV